LICVSTSYDRDTLEAVLSHDRADIPAVHRRTELAAREHPDRPRPRACPGWFSSWRAQLTGEREHLVARLEHGGPTYERDRRSLEQTDQLLAASDLYRSWLEGGSRSAIGISDAVTTLHEYAMRAPGVSAARGEPTRTQWFELLALAPEPALRPLGHERPGPAITLGR